VAKITEVLIVLKEGPDVGNGVNQFDNSLDLLLCSFDPVFDASEGLQAAQGQGFSKLQSENVFTFAKTNVTTKEICNDGVYLTNITGNLQNSKKMSNDASGSAQPGLSKSQDVGAFTLIKGLAYLPMGLVMQKICFMLIMLQISTVQ
jgi:hypothetical protein